MKTTENSKKELNDDIKLFNLFTNNNLLNYSKDTLRPNRSKPTVLYTSVDYMIFFNSSINFDGLPVFFHKYGLNISYNYDEKKDIGIQSKDSNEGINSEFCVTEKDYNDYLTGFENSMKEEDVDDTENWEENLEKMKNFDSYFLFKPINDTELNYLIILALYIMKSNETVLIYDTYSDFYYDNNDIKKLADSNNIIETCIIND